MTDRLPREEKITLRPSVGHIVALEIPLLGILLLGGAFTRGPAAHRWAWGALPLLCVLLPFALASLRTVTLTEHGLKLRRLRSRENVCWEELASVAVPRKRSALSASRVQVLVLTAHNRRRWTIALDSIRMSDRQRLMDAIERRARPGVIRWDAVMERAINGSDPSAWGG